MKALFMVNIMLARLFGFDQFRVFFVLDSQPLRSTGTSS